MSSRYRVSILCLIATALAACAGQADIQPTLPGGAHTRSWIAIDASCCGAALTEGDTWRVPVDYYLDADEARTGTTLNMWVPGPWIDTPDGTYVKERGHISYPDMWRSVPARAGRVHEVFTFKVPPALPHNRLLIICNFADAAGNRWPWEVRREGPWFRRNGGFFELETDRPANLFRYQDPVEIRARLKAAALVGGNRNLAYRVHDVTGAIVAEGAVAFAPERVGQVVAIRPRLNRRGTFLIQASVDGWETRETTFCRIPDVAAATHGAPSPLGVTNVVAPEDPVRLVQMCRAARLLGFGSCRTFANWYELEPGPSLFQLDEWQRALSVGRREGLDTWMCIGAPPAWALRGRMESFATDYRSVRCDWPAWREFVRTASTRFKGSLAGWEWLNEITPGGSESPVDDYLQLCRIGTQTAKAADPRLTTVMAGGLWPRSYRLEMLKAGVGRWIDVMPIHYSNGDGVREARADLDACGRQAAWVWDNESAKGVNAWSVPPLHELGDVAQSDWVLRQWTDELSAGAKKLIYFGGTGDPCGNYSYLLDDLSPRPVAATLAVFASKLTGARPLGGFQMGKSGVGHLFERDGKPVLVCFSAAGGEDVSLGVGSRPVTLTDYQGNERPVAVSGGVARVHLGALPVYLEGGDPALLKCRVACRVGPREDASASEQVTNPHVTLLRGKREHLSVRLCNLFGRPLTARVRIDAPAGWPAQTESVVALAPGRTAFVSVPVTAPLAADARDYETQVRVRLSWARLPQLVEHCVLSVITPDMVGNLLRNGGFEAADASGKGPEGWSVNGRTSRWATADGLGDGLGSRVLEFAGSSDWIASGQSLDLRGGQRYLYTAWIWNEDMHAGSNIGQEMADGTYSALYDQQVFNSGTRNGGWQVYTCRYQAPPGLKRATFSPLAQGKGWARFDNVRVTVFEGTDYAAECARATPMIDGSLDGWNTACPIPLIGRNQLTAVDPKYSWSQASFHAIAYVNWDASNLYLAVRVRDSVHRPLGTGDGVVEGDSVIVGIDPTNRSPAGAGRAFAYYLSAVAPGGGSGKATLYRPPSRAGGLRSGQLLKDSSVYDMVVHRDGGYTTYTVRLPFTELGGLRPALGAKFGLSVQVNNNDGAGLAAHLNWGEGLSPLWAPSTFGVVTFTK